MDWLASQCSHGFGLVNNHDETKAFEVGNVFVEHSLYGFILDYPYKIVIDVEDDCSFFT
jgi:hypothetical protein